MPLDENGGDRFPDRRERQHSFTSAAVCRYCGLSRGMAELLRSNCRPVVEPRLLKRWFYAIPGSESLAICPSLIGQLLRLPTAWDELRDRTAICRACCYGVLVGALVLLCYKLREPQKGQQGSCRSRARAILTRSVAMERGLCRSARVRRAAGLEVGRNPRRA
jgi:hypothetical protein